MAMSAWWRLSSSVVSPSSFSLSSYSLALSPEIILMALCCTFSRTSLSWAVQGDHACTVYSEFQVRSNILYVELEEDVSVTVVKGPGNLAENCWGRPGRLCTLGPWLQSSVA